MFVKSTRFKQLCQLLLSLIVAKFVRYSKGSLYIKVLFHIFYYYWGKGNNLLY